ncbi:MAG TPA: SDR family oxidoreductase [Solirubrobacterales bacterium]|nr:SDR family oxidoreductase [Solirubrobacterales bacterium]
MSQAFDIGGKVALVTGGSRGIGRAIAAAYVAAGARVYIAARDAEAAALTATELAAAGECVALDADLSREPECRRLAAAVAAREERLHVLVNNAGAIWNAPIEDFDDAAWDRVLALNVKGVFHLTKALLPLLEAGAGDLDPARVINVGSSDGIVVPPFDTFSYSASKAAVHHLTRHLARALAPRIAVNAIAPGPFETKMTATTLRTRPEKIVDATLLGRVGRPEEIAAPAVFLAAPASAYMTGAIVSVDGGLAVGA